jgi:hypothetical protein
MTTTTAISTSSPISAASRGVISGPLVCSNEFASGHRFDGTMRIAPDGGETNEQPDLGSSRVRTVGATSVPDRLACRSSGRRSSCRVGWRVGGFDYRLTRGSAATAITAASLSSSTAEALAERGHARATGGASS